MSDSFVNFSEALKMMREGHHVYRMAWQGKISYWRYDAGENKIVQVMADGTEKALESISIWNVLGEDWWIAV